MSMLVKIKSGKDPIYKLKRALRSRISESIRDGGFTKKSSLNDVIGCNWEFFKKWIENQWLPGMTWKNHTIHGWHIDHKIPLDSAITIEDIDKLNHYTNLQPMWSEDNIRKSNKL